MQRVNITLAVTFLFAALFTVGCDETKSPSKVLGKYENAHEKVSIEFKSREKAILTVDGEPEEIAWEMDGDGKVVIHGKDGMNLVLTINSEGHLSDSMGGVFRKK